MRIALLSDTHGNLIALDAVLADVSRRGGVDAYWVVGDVAAVGYDPVGVIERLVALPCARFVRGNTDRYTVTGAWPMRAPSAEDVQQDPETLHQMLLIARSYPGACLCLARSENPMTDPPRLPNWPPPDGKISIDEAREIIAWIREHAGPVLEEAERMLHERYPGAEIEREAVSVGDLVKWSGLTPTMPGLWVGMVWCSFMAGSFVMVDIVLDREGRLVIKPGMNMRK